MISKVKAISLEQRMTSAYLAMLPEFIPKKDAPVSIAEQRTFYDLIKNLYQLLYDDPVAFAYANPAWSDELPNIGNEYKIKHAGISAQYDAYVREPAALGLCIPYGMKPFLDLFDSMDPHLL